MKPDAIVSIDGVAVMVDIKTTNIPQNFEIAGHVFRPTGHQSFVCDMPNGRISVSRYYSNTAYWKEKKQQTWIASIMRNGHKIELTSRGKPRYFRMAFTAGAAALIAWNEQG